MQPISSLPPEIRERWESFNNECSESADKLAPYDEAMSDELRAVEHELEDTPAESLSGILAKLRWAVAALLSGDGDPDLPTLENAYSWRGDGQLATVVARIWADAERLLGARGDGIQEGQLPTGEQAAE